MSLRWWRKKSIGPIGMALVSRHCPTISSSGTFEGRNCRVTKQNVLFHYCQHYSFRRQQAKLHYIYFWRYGIGILFVIVHCSHI